MESNVKTLKHPEGKTKEQEHELTEVHVPPVCDI